MLLAVVYWSFYESQIVDPLFLPAFYWPNIHLEKKKKIRSTRSAQLGLLFPQEVPNGRRCGIHPPVYIELSDVLCACFLSFRLLAPGRISTATHAVLSLYILDRLLYYDDGIEGGKKISDGMTGHLRADANRPESCNPLAKTDIGDDAKLIRLEGNDRHLNFFKEYLI